MLRSIEFIYESAGVNRPLTLSDNPEKNLNKTYYRDQINKVANAVKEIISTLKKHSLHLEEVPYIKTVQAPAKKAEIENNFWILNSANINNCRDFSCSKTDRIFRTYR